VQAARQRAQRTLREIRAVLPKLEPKARESFEDYLKLFAQPMSSAGPVTPGSGGG
jgi:hypothetical protein